MEELENEISTQAEENTVSLASAQALADALAKIEVYTPTTWVDNSSPDIDAEHLNKPEQAIKRVTDALNSAVDVIKDLQSQITKNSGAISDVNNNLSDTKKNVTQLYSDLSKLHVNYSYNGTDGINDVYESMSDMSSLHIWTDGNTKIGQELGLSQTYEGCEVVIWKGTSWRGGAIAYLGAGSAAQIGLINGKNIIKWYPIALKSDLAASQSNPYVVTLQNTINGSLFSSAQYRSCRTEGGTGAAAYGFENVGVNSGALYLDPSDYKLHFINYDGKKFIINWTEEN